MSDLLDLAVRAHGGLDQWKKVKTIDARVTLTGGLYRIKGDEQKFIDVSLRLTVDRPSAIVSPYPKPGRRGFFTPERVWIEDSAGKLIEERTNPHGSFADHVLQTPWDDFHRLYFTSYAMWNYLTAPFLFTQPGFECKEIEPQKEGSATWRRLQVKFPADIPTHDGTIAGSKERLEEVFYFNEQGLLQRLDYVAVSPASHYVFDHQNFGGILFPTFRRVVPRSPSGPAVFGPSAVLLHISDVMLS